MLMANFLSKASKTLAAQPRLVQSKFRLNPPSQVPMRIYSVVLYYLGAGAAPFRPTCKGR